MKILSPLRDRDFALLWIGLTISLIGDGIYLVAIAWQAYEISNTPSALAIVGLAWSLGLALFLLTGGVISDRFDRRRVMIAADIVRAAVLVLMGVLASLGALEIWHMVVMVLIYAGGEAFFGPALGALVPDILEREQLVQASALEQLVRQACRRLIGPALGGLIVAVVGPGDAFLIDAGTFLLSATAIALMRTRSAGSRTAGSTIRREMVEGLRYVRERRWLWVTFLASSLAMLAFFGPMEVLLPYIVKNELDGGAGDFGLVLAADGAGAILASIVIGQRELPRRYLTVIYVSWAGATLPLVGYALASSVWQLMILSAMYGALITIGLVIWITLQQTRVPSSMLGRVHSVDWFTSVGLAPLSFALTAPAASLLGVKTTLILAGVVPTITMIVLYTAFHMRREQPPIEARDALLLTPQEGALDASIAARTALEPTYDGRGAADSAGVASGPVSGAADAPPPGAGERS